MKAALVVIVALVPAAAASGAGTATRIIERTLLCTVPEQQTFPDPTRTISVSSTPKRGKWSASTSVFTLDTEEDAQFAVGLTTGSTPRNPLGYLAWTRAPRCGPSGNGCRSRAPGSRAGRRSSPRSTSATSRRRWSSTFAPSSRSRSRSGSTPASPQLFAKGNISSGQLVVATPDGKRLTYGSAEGGTGRVKLFAAKFPTCS